MTALLAAGAAVDETNGDGATPLHFAARKGRTEVAAALLAVGAAVDAIDRVGDTPLNFAALKN